MAAENHRFAAARERENQVLHLAATDGIEARSGFVQNHEVGVVDQRLRESDAALHALREFADDARLHLTEADHFEELFVAKFFIRGGKPKEAAEKIERLLRVEIAVEIRFLGQIADAHLGANMARRTAENLNVAAGRIEQTEEQLDGGGLAGTIRPEESEDLAAADIEIHVVHGAGLGAAPEILENLREATNGNDHVVGVGADRGWRGGRF